MNGLDLITFARKLKCNNYQSKIDSIEVKISYLSKNFREKYKLTL